MSWVSLPSSQTRRATALFHTFRLALLLSQPTAIVNHHQRATGMQRDALAPQAIAALLELRGPVSLADFTRQDDVGLVVAKHNVFSPAKIPQPLPAVFSQQALGTVERQQMNRFLPGGGLAAILEGQDVSPIKQQASSER
jgi:hypothetical protein